ncbi:outer membrane beta-barrel protein [Aquisalimonas asiatica]|uniref:Outer membrane protein beta-barrel domain-containing protein n=1 Tax=Aquisalimonas asiatica TaxID=406100 RepID=A0A1H8TXR2_9GAMM|nr:outer membrane beta-barrel protein [Aquisalimonas asiatica]SEO95769.1 Outer membrane protein beta-barrel domain-containing protein [Aquisalimonas asiatica]
MPAHRVTRRPWPALLAFTTAAAMTLPATVSAEDSFFGVGVGQHRVHFDSDDRDNFDVGTEDELGLQLRVGMVRPNSRLYGQWSIISGSDFFLTSLTVNQDFLWRVAPSVQLYGGLGGGAVTLSWNGDNSIDTMPGLSAQAGVMVEITRTVHVELGARQLFTRLRTDPEGADGNDVDVDLDRIGVASASVNLQF